MAWCCNTPRPGTGNAQRERERGEQRGRRCDASRRLLITYCLPHMIMRTDRSNWICITWILSKNSHTRRAQQSGNCFSAFKTSHDLKIIESSVLTQSSQLASSVLRLLLPGRQLLTSQHRGEQQLLGGRGLLSLKSTLHLEAARRSGLSCSGSLCSCVLIVRNNEKRMAGQPAFGTVSNAAFWEIRVGVGRGEAGRGGQDAGTRRETERRMHANAHEHTCTHIPERACLGSYMCQNTLVFINQPITKFYLFFFF